MIRILGALILFGLGAYAGSQARDGYADGRMPVLALWTPVNPLIFAREDNAVLFWAATVLNAALAVCMVLGGLLFFFAGVHSA